LKRVLLINTNIEKSPYPVPPLGLCLVASVLENRYITLVYDGVFDEGKSLVDTVRKFNPDYVGFSIRNVDDTVMDRDIFYLDRIITDFIQPVRNVTSVPLILGGSGFSIFPEEIMKLTGADYGIVGEGEDIFPLLLDHLDRGTDIAHIPNLIRSSKQFSDRNYHAPARSKPNSTGASEIFRRVDFIPYLQRGAYPVQTKRGCSHGCIYCTYPHLEGKHFRVREPSEIADEIEAVDDRFGNVMFEFVDSTFNDPAGYAEAICREIIKRGRKFRLRTMGINPRHTSDGLFNLMMEAGFVQIDATPDTASPAMLESLGKGFSLEDIGKMALLIRKFDLPAMWFFLFGGPGENGDTYRETIDFIDRFVNPDDMVYMNAGLRIYPNTPLHSVAIKEGRIRPGQSVFDPPVYYFSREMPKEILDAAIRETSSGRPNCISSSDTVPPAEMVKEAIGIRTATGTGEPMFRTLMKIRRRWVSEGRL
jgi:radical SAM superfamily enzyme YgiQ (UPF0313 family)